MEIIYIRNHNEFFISVTEVSMLVSLVSMLVSLWLIEANKYDLEAVTLGTDGIVENFNRKGRKSFSIVSFINLRNLGRVISILMSILMSDETFIGSRLSITSCDASNCKIVAMSVMSIL
jgi:hypothetical protein